MEYARTCQRDGVVDGVESKMKYITTIPKELLMSKAEAPQPYQYMTKEQAQAELDEWYKIRHDNWSLEKLVHIVRLEATIKSLNKSLTIKK